MVPFLFSLHFCLNCPCSVQRATLAPGVSRPPMTSRHVSLAWRVKKYIGSTTFAKISWIESFFFHVSKGKRSRGSLFTGNTTPRDAGWEIHTHKGLPAARGWELGLSIVQAAWWLGWQRDASLTTGWLCANIQTRIITGWKGRGRSSWASSYRIATLREASWFPQVSL